MSIKSGFLLLICLSTTFFCSTKTPVLSEPVADKESTKVEEPARDSSVEIKGIETQNNLDPVEMEKISPAESTEAFKSGLGVLVFDAVLENEHIELFKNVEAYWSAFVQGNLLECYNFYSAEYRKQVSIQEFLRQKSLSVALLHVYEIQKKRDSILVKFQAEGQHEQFSLKNFPVLQEWFKSKENGKWYIKKEPRSKSKMSF